MKRATNKHGLILLALNLLLVAAPCSARRAQIGLRRGLTSPPEPQVAVDVVKGDLQTRITYVDVTNDASAAATVSVMAAGDLSSWDVRVFDAEVGGTDITASLWTEQGWISSFAGDETRTLRIEVASQTGQKGEALRVDLTTSIDFQIVAGQVVPGEDFTARVDILGAAITYGAGGYDIPVTANLDMGLTKVEPWGNINFAISSNLNDGLNPRSHSLPAIYPAGTPISIEATSWKRKTTPSGLDFTLDSSWIKNLTHNSSGPNPFVLVLRDGDAVPAIEGFSNQASIADFVAGYVVGGRISLAPNRAIYLFELGTTDLSSSAADFQDLVALVTLAAAGSASDDSGGTTASTPGSSATLNATVIGCQPDLQVGLTQTGPFEGDGQYCPADAPMALPANQVDGRTYLEYFIKLENDGTVADDFVLKQELSSHQNWIARYFDLSDLGKEVTQSIQSPDGWIASDGLAGGDSKLIRLVVVPGAKADVPEGINPEELALRIKANSNGDELRQDVMQLTTVKQKGRLRIIDYRQVQASASASGTASYPNAPAHDEDGN